MLHRLCGSPSIPLSFSLAAVLPRRITYRICFGADTLHAHTQWSSFTARTTRVSNPVCSPSFRTSASVSVQWTIFIIGIPTHIYEFHLYSCSSVHLSSTLVNQFRRQAYGWATSFHLRLDWPPRCPLRPIIPENACDIRITAAAGTYLAVASSAGTVTSFFPAESTLQSENLHRAHRSAGSEFPPLSNIPHCCLP